MTSNHKNRRMNFESMEKRELFAADLGIDVALSPRTAPAEASTPQASLAMVATAEPADQPACYLKYKLDRVFVKSWSTSGDADDRPTEEVAFYYNKIAFAYAATLDGEAQGDFLLIVNNASAGQDGDDLLIVNNGDGSDFLETANEAYFVKVDSDTTTEYEAGRWFVADSFSFAVEREMKESGEKGGTEDMNIGLGELQECTISKSMDRASSVLAHFAINGNSPGLAEIDFVEVAGEPNTAATEQAIQDLEVVEDEIHRFQTYASLI